jgi:small subunit ribosomal protein S6
VFSILRKHALAVDQSYGGAQFMALYEITFLTKEESDPGVRTTLEEAGLSIQEESTLGRKRLAYPIKKETQAVYTSYVFDAAPTAITELNRKLSLNTNILRYLIVTKEIARANKEVSKTVREAIAAAEKLEDTVVETPAIVEAETPVVEEETVVEAPVEAETPAVEELVEAPTEESVAVAAEPAKPARKPRAKKAEAPEENAATATEEDRLKALEDKLGEILKD